MPLIVCLLVVQNASAQTPESFNPDITGGDVYCSVALPDGRIMVGGDFTSVGGVSRPKMARLFASGALDPNFILNNLSGPVTAIIPQPDGKMILIGGSVLGPTARSYIHRVQPDGAVDPTFADPAVDASISCALVLPDGKVMIGGSFNYIGAIQRSHLARLNSDGTLDASFNPTPAPNGRVNTLALQADGELLIGGAFFPSIKRLNADGSLDSTFTASANVEVYTLVVQPDGKILMGGFFDTVNSVARSRAARLNADGTLDTGFNPNVTGGSVHTMALQANGKSLIGGSFTKVGGVTRNRAARLNTDGTLDSTFNPNADGNVKNVMLQPDGKALIGGGFVTIGGVTRHRLARLPNEAATQTVTVTGISQADWLRGGSTPEVEQVSFETWNGSDWVFQGNGARVSGGWRATGLSLPASAWIRALGYSACGYYSTSSSIIQQTTTYGGGTFPDITVEQPIATALVDAVSVVDFGTRDWLSVSPAKTFTIRNNGTATLSGISVSIGGAYPADFSATAPAATTLVPGASTTFHVTFTPRGGRSRSAALAITSNDADETTFDITLTGTGQHLDAPFNPGINGGQVLSTLVQPDGKIVVGGDFVTAGGALRNRMARLNTDGTLDTAFDSNVNGTVNAVVLFPPGKFLIGGDFTTIGGVTRNRAARLNTDGTWESGSNIDANATILCQAAQTDEKTVVGGDFTLIHSQTFSRITRLTTTGFNDSPGFVPNANSTVSSLAIQGDGNILVGGAFWVMNSTARSRLARLTTAGVLDTVFDPNPSHTFAPFTVSCIAVQADGKILISGGFDAVGGVTRNFLARLNTNGTLDTGFDPNPNAIVNSIALQCDGRILIGGNFTQVNWVDRSYIARLNADGSLDTNFDPGANAPVAGLALQPDGKILVGGNFTSMGGVARNYLVRLPNDSVATQDLSVTGTSQITWTRGGACPEIEQVNFETWNGTGWTNRGAASRIAGGWRKTGLSIPAGGWVRARGRAVGGRYNGSSGLIEQTVNYGTAFPDIAVEQPVGTSLSDGATTTSFGPVAVSAPKVVTYTIRNTGAASLTGIAITKDGTEAADFSVGAPGATSLAAGASTTFSVTFTPLDYGLRRAAIHVASSDFDETPFDINLEGTGVTSQEAWRNTFFGTINNSGNAADNFDLDLDGLVNLLEYAFGLNPTLGSSVLLPQGQMVGNTFQMSFTTPTGVSGVAYEGEWSSSLATNDWNPIPDTGIAPQHTFSVPVSAGTRIFIRIKVTGQ